MNQHTIQQHVVAWGSGAITALLLARLLARLMAARPDNPIIQALYTLTDALRVPLAWLDVAQPRFGAVLEISTLMLAIIVPILGYLLWYGVGRVRPATLPVETSSK